MVKVLVLFGNPTDGGAFDRHFTEIHRPLLTTLPGLDDVQIDRVAGVLTGESPFHLVVELRFASEEAIAQALARQWDQVPPIPRDTPARVSISAVVVPA